MADCDSWPWAILIITSWGVDSDLEPVPHWEKRSAPHPDVLVHPDPAQHLAALLRQFAEMDATPSAACADHFSAYEYNLPVPTEIIEEDGWRDVQTVYEGYLLAVHACKTQTAEQSWRMWVAAEYYRAVCTICCEHKARWQHIAELPVFVSQPTPAAANALLLALAGDLTGPVPPDVPQGHQDPQGQPGVTRDGKKNTTAARALVIAERLLRETGEVPSLQKIADVMEDEGHGRKRSTLSRNDSVRQGLDNLRQTQKTGNVQGGQLEGGGAERGRAVPTRAVYEDWDAVDTRVDAEQAAKRRKK